MKAFSVNDNVLVLLAATMSVFTVETVQAKTETVNRNDVYTVLKSLNASQSTSSVDIWVNEKSEYPVVHIGDPIYFTMTSEDPAFYTLIYVDSKGGSSVLKPMSQSIDFPADASEYLVYPSLTNGCKEFQRSDICLQSEYQFIQDGPIGQDAIYLIASKSAIPNEILGLDVHEGFREMGKDIVAVKALVNRINSHAKRNPLSVVRYTYAVDSTDTQHTTRSIRRKVKELDTEANGDGDSMNFNNINFAYNSDQLTSDGKQELDGLGSALVWFEEENGEFLSVKLIGHTDSIASEQYNIALSAKRAESAREYLVSEHGVPFNTVSTVGAGESDPIDSNNTDSGRARNRRVELEVMDK